MYEDNFGIILPRRWLAVGVERGKSATQLVLWTFGHPCYSLSQNSDEICALQLRNQQSRAEHGTVYWLFEAAVDVDSVNTDGECAYLLLLKSMHAPNTGIFKQTALK